MKTTMDAFETAVCDTLNARDGTLWSVVPGTQSQEYQDESGERMQLLTGNEITGYTRERLEENGNLPDDGDEAEREIRNEVEGWETILVNWPEPTALGGNSSRFFYLIPQK